MTKRSPRMVIRSSCVLPPSDRRRKVLRRLSSITRCWRSISRRMRRRSGDASSLSEPSGLSRERSERARLASCAPARQLAQRLQPSELRGHRFGRALDQRLPGGDVIHQKEQVANLFRLQQRSLDARLIGQLGGIEQPAQRGGDPLPQQQAHLAHQVVLAVNPGEIPRRLHAPAATRAPRGNGQNSPPAPAGGSIRAPRSCIPPPPTELALRDSLDHARAWVGVHSEPLTFAHLFNISRNVVNYVTNRRPQREENPICR